MQIITQAVYMQDIGSSVGQVVQVRQCSLAPGTQVPCIQQVQQVQQGKSRLAPLGSRKGNGLAGAEAGMCAGAARAQHGHNKGRAAGVAVVMQEVGGLDHMYVILHMYILYIIIYYTILYVQIYIMQNKGGIKRLLSESSELLLCHILRGWCWPCH